MIENKPEVRRKLFSSRGAYSERATIHFYAMVASRCFDRCATAMTLSATCFERLTLREPDSMRGSLVDILLQSLA